VTHSRGRKYNCHPERSEGSFATRKDPSASPRDDNFRLWTLCVLILGLLAFPALAVEPSEMLKDPALEARAREIGRALRCVVCQNQAIDDSSAEVAHDMRRAVRERLTAGDSDDAVFAFMVARYGDYVLLKPPFKSGTLLLWLGGPLVLLVAGGALLLAARKRRVPEPPAPLTEEERRRVEALLHPPSVTPSEAEGPPHVAAIRGGPSTSLRSARDDG
jgi:cytochrome c-type biogenesis protein CcmH